MSLDIDLELKVEGEEFVAAVDGDDDGRGDDLAKDRTEEKVGDEQVETLSLPFDDRSRGSIWCSLIFSNIFLFKSRFYKCVLLV